MRVKYFLFLTLASLMLFSCKGKKAKQTANEGSNTDTQKTATTVIDEATLAKAKSVFDFKEDFKTYEAQFNLKFESPEKNLSASGTIRVAQDSLMWLYVKAFGFEVARAKFTQDSVTAVVKLKSQYFKGDYSLVKNYIPVAANYEILQSLFINRMFIFPDNKADNLSYFSMSMDNDKILNLSTLSNADFLRNYHFHNSLTVDTDIRKMTSTKVLYPQQNKEVTIKYSEYQEFAGHLTPTVMEISMDSNVLTFTFNKIVFDKNLNFPLSIPDSYKPFNL